MGGTKDRKTEVDDIELTIESTLVSDIGKRRAQNQDSGGSFPDLRLFVVADGMGGHRGGEVASKMAVEAIHETFERALESGKSGRAALGDASKLANQKIMERARKETELEGMGTTVTSLYFDIPGHGEQSKAWVGHVGDSRCYLIRRDGIWQVTRDHSLVQEKLRAGMITRDQLKTDRMKNVITRSVGFDLNFGIDIYEYTPYPGDLFLLCSDGLSGPLDDSMIFETAERVYFSAIDTPAFEGREQGYGALLKKFTEALVQGANNEGGDDNITALVVRYPGAGVAR